MEKMILSEDVEKKVKVYAKKKKISFQKACEKLFDIGVCHLLSQKKIDRLRESSLKKNKFFDAGVCHPTGKIKRIIIVEVA